MCRRPRTTGCGARSPPSGRRPSCCTSSQQQDSGITKQIINYVIKCCYTTYDDVKFGVNVDQFPLVVDYWKGRDSFPHKFVQSLDDASARLGDLHVVKGADAQLSNGLAQIARLGQVMDLHL